jgi:polyisoprenoid-binding protein YceI
VTIARQRSFNTGMTTPPARDPQRAGDAPAPRRDRTPGSQHGRRRLLLGGLAAMLLGLDGCADLRSALRMQDRDLAAVPAGSYRLDPEHCSVVFSVDHLGFSRVIMRFDHARATLQWPRGGVSTARVEARVRSDSIDTNVALLDRELRSPAMLDAARHPYIRWRADGWRATGPRRGDVSGMLTLGRASTPLLLHVRFNGYGIDPVTGAPTLGFSARGEFSRNQLGLKAWPGLVGDTVRLHIEAEFVAAATAG